MKKAIVSVINDLTTDQRVHKICCSLQQYGYEVVLTGRKLRNSLPVAREYQTKRFKLLANEGFMFYACYNVRLFFYLLFKRTDLLWSNDLDTLCANYLISKWRNIPLIYDSHEYFTEVPELIDRKRVQRFWLSIEKRIFPKLKYVFSVSPSIAAEYSKKYGVDVQTLFNFPLKRDENAAYDSSKNIILYQGSVNKNRGIEELVEAMQLVENATLWIIGVGDEFENCKKLASNLKLNEKVIFKGRILPEKLYELTKQATIGVSLEKKTGLNYTFALPNKLFDYCAAGIPVLVSDLPEMAKFVVQNEIGIVLKNYSSKEIVATINEMLKDKNQLNKWHLNAARTAEKCKWQNEEKKIFEILKQIEKQ